MLTVVPKKACCGLAPRQGTKDDTSRTFQRPSINKNQEELDATASKVVIENFIIIIIIIFIFIIVVFVIGFGFAAQMGWVLVDRMMQRERERGE